VPLAVAAVSRLPSRLRDSLPLIAVLQARLRPAATAVAPPADAT
jgi:hypothetical protein